MDARLMWGNTNRTQDGPVIVALTLDRFLELLRKECE
jgi:hypothetical protein